jgi:hypothetical protein
VAVSVKVFTLLGIQFTEFPVAVAVIIGVVTALNCPLTLPPGGATTAAAGIASIARAIETTAIAAPYLFMFIGSFPSFNSILNPLFRGIDGP